MESVPETERLEEFRPSPLPSLRLHSITTSFGPAAADAPGQTQQQQPDGSRLPASPSSADPVKKPPTVRRATDPPISPSSPSFLSASSLPFRPRTASPLSGHHHSHTRSTSLIVPPPMSRTQSMPGVNGAGQFIYSPQGEIIRRPASPSGSGSPSRAPRVPRKAADESFPTSPVRQSVLEPSERRITERNSSPNLGVSSSSPLGKHSRRPASPLRHVAHGASSAFPPPSTPTSVSSSPASRPADTLPGSYGSTVLFPSSVPSTPTSTRSRSPSISSLETIPDSPDAEEAALEAERIAQLKAAADAAEGESKSGRSSLDVPSRGRTLGFGSRDKRKRWSVCGAERRGDIDLETIWED